MQLPSPPARIAEAGLRAMKTVALADGMFKPIERDMMAALQTHIAKTAFNIDELELIDGEELAERVEPGPYRDRVLFAAILVALSDGDVSAEERATVDEFAAALGVNDESISTFHRFADGQYALMRVDLLRRFVARDRLELTVRKYGLGPIWETVYTQLRRGSNDQVLERYEAFALLPEGTLGRGYYDFMTKKGLPMPGKEGSQPAIIAFHDCMHVLSGYDITPTEETQIAAFHAGMRQQDFMGMLLFAVSQFHLGVAITPATEGVVGHLRPDLLISAFVRGTHVTCDMAKEWDHTLDWERSISDIREQYNIIPR